MKPVFADTVFFLALINRRDQYHQSAVDHYASLSESLLTTAWILVELANAISASPLRRQFEHVLEALNEQSDAKVVEPSTELYNEGCRLYLSRPDKEWSLTDCISFIVMEREGLVDVLTADRHFEQAGFRILLHTR